MLTDAEFFFENSFSIFKTKREKKIKLLTWITTISTTYTARTLAHVCCNYFSLFFHVSLFLFLFLTTKCGHWNLYFFFLFFWWRKKMQLFHLTMGNWRERQRRIKRKKHMFVIDSYSVKSDCFHPIKHNNKTAFYTIRYWFVFLFSYINCNVRF